MNEWMERSQGGNRQGGEEWEGGRGEKRRLSDCVGPTRTSESGHKVQYEYEYGYKYDCEYECGLVDR